MRIYAWYAGVLNYWLIIKFYRKYFSADLEALSKFFFFFFL